mgnify:CR=1 FL=1
MFRTIKTTLAVATSGALLSTTAMAADLVINFDDLNPLPLQPGRTWMEIPRNLDDVVSWEAG